MSRQTSSNPSGSEQFDFFTGSEIGVTDPNAYQGSGEPQGFAVPTSCGCDYRPVEEQEADLAANRSPEAQAALDAD